MQQGKLWRELFTSRPSILHKTTAKVGVLGAHGEKDEAAGDHSHAGEGEAEEVVEGL